MTGIPTAGRDRPRSHSIQNALVAAAILAEFVLIIGHPLFGCGSTTYAATPRPLIYNVPLPPSGRQVLLALSTAAAREPAQLAPAGTRYAYIRTQEWHLAARKGGQAPASTVRPTVTESWLEPDGAGRVVNVTTAAKGSATDVVTVPAGHPLAALSAGEASLARLFGLRLPSPAPSARQFVEFVDLAGRQPISPPEEASILKLLALTPGVTNSGTATDRYGRPGVAVSVASGYTGVEILYTLVFDPSTGTLLEADQTLDGDPGHLDAPQGSVLAYTTFLSSGYVASPTARPPA